MNIPNAILIALCHWYGCEIWIIKYSELLCMFLILIILTSAKSGFLPGWLYIDFQNHWSEFYSHLPCPCVETISPPCRLMLISIQLHCTLTAYVYSTANFHCEFCLISQSDMVYIDIHNYKEKYVKRTAFYYRMSHIVNIYHISFTFKCSPNHSTTNPASRLRLQ